MCVPVSVSERVCVSMDVHGFAWVWEGVYVCMDMGVRVCEHGVHMHACGRGVCEHWCVHARGCV